MKEKILGDLAMAEVPFVRTPYNYNMMEASNASGLRCEDPSLAVQDQRDEVDINTIVKRFGLTGKLPEDIRAPTYGDFTGITDYQSALNAVIAADEAFMAMPADVRARFGNDPAAFVDFCSDAKNAEEAAKLGLLSPEVVLAREKASREAAAVASGLKASTQAGKGESDGTA